MYNKKKEKTKTQQINKKTKLYNIKKRKTKTPQINKKTKN